jgi:hypothetical protein
MPVLEPRYVIPCVGNPADEKLCVFNGVYPMTLLWTIAHDRMNANGHDIILTTTNVSLPYDEETQNNSYVVR